MAEIKITRKSPTVFHVEVTERTSQSVHEVTANEDDVQRYGGGVSAEYLIEQSFEFLLEREPKEAILRAFALPVIEHYFREYPHEIRQRLG